MSRYIDVDKLFLHFNDWALAESPDERLCDVPEYSEYYVHEMIYRTISEAMSAIEQQETAEVCEVVRGKWIKHIDNLYPQESTEECSVCHHHQFLSVMLDNNYCPNCGARMDERREDDKGRSN